MSSRYRQQLVCSRNPVQLDCRYRTQVVKGKRSRYRQQVEVVCIGSSMGSRCRTQVQVVGIGSRYRTQVVDCRYRTQVVGSMQQVYYIGSRFRQQVQDIGIGHIIGHRQQVYVVGSRYTVLCILYRYVFLSTFATTELVKIRNQLHGLTQKTYMYMRNHLHP